ncbi:MAG: BlaI/MecI/CopY family transcriptional regulator [Thermonemataceae bacterium]|nr:BlaI/MecI/CopY family transcriptional regulator [Thermonemataceae bacterium]
MQKIKLDDLQIAVMRVLWQLGEATVTQVQEALKEDRGLAVTTIGTILSRLEKKGAVKHRAEGKKFIYEALVTEIETRRTMLSGLINQLFQGKTSTLVNHLLNESEFDSNEIEELQKILSQAHQQKGVKDE